MNSYKDTAFWIFVSVFVVVGYLAIGDLLEFAKGKSPIVSEFISAVFGSIITVAAMAVMLRMQSRQEQHREFSSRLFDRKLELYTDLLNTVFACDDDNLIEKDEIQEIENKVGVCCLVASEDLVSVFSQFVYQIKVYGVLYYRSMVTEQIEHFSKFVDSELNMNDPIGSKLAVCKYNLALPVSGNEMDYFVSLDDCIQMIRKDLAVVEGNVRKDIEHFVRTEIDKYNIMKDPNVVD